MMAMKRPQQELLATADALDLEPLLKRLRALQGGPAVADQLRAAHVAMQGGRSDEARECAASVLAAGWSALHAGHWAQVDVAWRSAYAVAALISAAGDMETGRALKTVDLGLMLGDSTFRELLLKAADHLECTLHTNELCADAVGKPGRPPFEPHAAAAPRVLTGTEPPLPRLRLPSLAFFHNELMVPGRPAVLTGVLDGWPARNERPWTDLSYLKAVAGARTVPVEVGAHYLDAAFDETLMTLVEFLELHIEPSPPPPGAVRAYLAQHQLFDQVPALRRDIIIPDYCCLSIEDEGEGEGEEGDESRSVVSSAVVAPRVNAWLGPTGTLSPLHYDRSHNLLCQVVGSKYVRLYAPDEASNLYPHAEGPHVVSSQIVDPDAVDQAAFPRFAGASYVDLVLAEGECLYIPPGWWHMIESREVSFSVSFWW